MTRIPVRPWALVLAAGQGKRLSAATGGHSKQFLLWKGVPLYWHSARTLARSGAVAGLVFVFPQDCLEEEKQRLTQLARNEDPGIPWLAVAGGAERQDSVRHGLAALPRGAAHVLVHDSARPFMSAALVHRVCDALAAGAVAVIPGLAVTDTIKVVCDDLVTDTPPRARLRAVQTPQGFALPPLLAAHDAARQESAAGRAATDDAALMEAHGHPVLVVPGEAANIKITHPEDLALLEERSPVMPVPRVGMGYDVHRYGNGRPMKLGGIIIPNAPEVIAHSDGDVLLHALMDALLGCAALGDIGRLFPDADARFDNISSAVLLDDVLERFRDAGLTLCHVDLTIVAQTPKLAPHREEIRKNVARLLGLGTDSVNIKATTEEKLGFTGACEGIKAYAVATAFQLPPHSRNTKEMA